MPCLSRSLPSLLLLAALASCGLLVRRLVGGASSGTAFLASAAAPPAPAAPASVVEEEEEEEIPGGFTLLNWLHYKVILPSRKSYPVALMLGFNCYGNVLLRKECGDKPYPNWIFGFPLAFICYTYPGAIFSDLIFVNDAPMRAMSSDSVFIVFTFWFVVIQNSERVYRFFLRKHVFLFLTTWWLADATRASLCFLERTVSHNPVFSRGLWQAFVWCAAGPIMRVAEACIRGKAPPPLDKLQPNTFNAFKYPLIAMWMLMVLYLIILGFFTDCNIFGKGGLTMVQCGDRYEDLYAAFVYIACLLHLGRGYYSMYTNGGSVNIFAEGFCMGACAK